MNTMKWKLKIAYNLQVNLKSKEIFTCWITPQLVSQSGTISLKMSLPRYCCNWIWKSFGSFTFDIVRL